MVLYYIFSMILMLIGAFGLAFVGSWAFSVVGGLVGFFGGAILAAFLAPIIYNAFFPKSQARNAG